MSAGLRLTVTGRTPPGEEVVLRPLRHRDRKEFLEVRRVNREWLDPWEPTSPLPGPPQQAYPAYLRRLNAGARAGTTIPLVITIDGRIVGQVTVSSIVEGAARSGSIGYWVAEEMAGRWVTPTAVALVCTHLFDPEGRALHRVEINVRPENVASLAVPRKLGFRDEGLRTRFLHIAGDWRDHRAFALLAEDVPPEGLLSRLNHTYQESLPRHTD